MSLPNLVHIEILTYKHWPDEDNVRTTYLDKVTNYSYFFYFLVIFHSKVALFFSQEYLGLFPETEVIAGNVHFLGALGAIPCIQLLGEGSWYYKGSENTRNENLTSLSKH
jgi:hypothetical protein